ncbi:MAG TPA: hypothetical protein VEK57_30340 [Thermoanaerobaculia bacterium]|nr:hypothetical protein [Thermoanaerobaculia bacterium]
MRSSSIKSFAATLTLFAVISTAATVNLQARPTRQAADTVVSIRDTENSYDRLYAAVRHLLKRFRGMVSNSTLTTPLPAPAQATTTSTTN